jgi:hypothetical protein
MEAEIVANAPSRQEAERILERAHIVYDHSAKHLNARSEIQTGNASASPSIGQLFMGMVDNMTTSIAGRNNNRKNDETTTIDQKNLRVHYRLMVPEGSKLILDNKYGDIVLSSETGNLALKGKVQISLAHGNLTATQPVASGEINLSFGKALMRSFEQGSFTLKYASLSLQQAGEVSLHGTTAEVNIDSAGHIRLDSRNDNLELGKVNKLSGKSYFTQMNIGELSQEANLDMQLGEFRLGRLRPSFTMVELKSRQTSIRLQTENPTDALIEISGSIEMADLPVRTQKIEKSGGDPMQPNGILKGTLGNGGRRTIKIQSTDAHVSIR